MAATVRDGVSLNYEVEGDGSPLLLVHGHTLDLTIWDDLVAPLVAGGFRVVRYDLRGHGRSDRPESEYRPTDHADDAFAVLDAVGENRAAVVGYSIGGGVALEMALADPDRIGRMVLLSPVLPDRPFEAAFFDNLRAVARAIRTEGLEAAMSGPWMESPLWASSVAKPQVADRLRQIVRRFPGAEYLATERDRPNRDWVVPDRLGEISQPTLVAVGEHEMPGFIHWAHEIANEVPHAELEKLEGMGHLHLLENPRQVADLISRFAASVE